MNKTMYKMILLGGLSLLALASCQKDENKRGREVNFTAATATTKAAYATGTDGTVGKYQRIDWELGDSLVIFSDRAETPQGQKSALYEVSSVTAAGATSKAKLKSDEEAMLRYSETDKDPYTFAAAFPKSGFSFTDNGAKVNCIIPSQQTITNTGFPAMTSVLMLADPVTVDWYAPVSLNFRPVFTTFEFKFTAEKDMKLTGFMMKSEPKDESTTPSTLHGGFDYEINLAATEPEWTPTIQNGDNRNFIQATFPTALQLTAGQETMFGIYTLPVDITDLSFIFYVQFEENGQTKNETRTLRVTYAKTENGHNAGDPVTFTGGLKHNITGITIPANMSKIINLELAVIDWDDETGTITYGTDPVVNALALEYSNGAAVNSGSSRRWNNNFANDTDPIDAYFSVYSPTGAKWRIKVSGDIDKLPVTSENATSSSTTDGVLTLEGNVGGRVHFTVGRANSPTASNQIQLNFYVVIGTGANEREISMNSEITRKNALTITGKVGQ